jgi:hypothetical protein
MYRELLSAGEYDNAYEYAQLLTFAREEYEEELAEEQAKEEYEREEYERECLIEHQEREK